MDSPLSATATRKEEGSATPRQTLTIVDNRTGKSYEIPITHGTIRAADLRAFHCLSRRERHLQRRVAQEADLSSGRKNSDDCRVLLSAHSGNAVRLSGQRAQLSRQFPEHALSHYRAEVSAESNAGTRPRRSLYSSC